MSEPPNNEMNLTKPAQAMELRRLSQCSADQSAYEALVVGTQDCRMAGGNSGWQHLQ